MTDRNSAQESVLLRLLKGFGGDRAGADRAPSAVASLHVEMIRSAPALSCSLAHPPPAIVSFNPLFLSHMPECENAPLVRIKPDAINDPLMSTISKLLTRSTQLGWQYLPRTFSRTPDRFTAPGTSSNLIKIEPPASRVLSSCLPKSISDQVPLTRRKAAGQNEALFSREKKLLSAASAVPESDIEWIGLFRSLPLTAVSSMEIKAQGELSLYLKPDAAKLLEGRKKPLLDLVIGRDKRTGVMIKAVMNE